MTFIYIAQKVSETMTSTEANKPSKGKRTFRNRIKLSVLLLLTFWFCTAHAEKPAEDPAGRATVSGPAGSDNDTGVFRVRGLVVQGSPDGSAGSGYRYRDGELGPLGRASLKDVPYSLHVTSGELIENRNAHNPADALKTVPTVVPLMSSSGYSSMHRLMVRGFSASDQSDLRDGMTDRSFTLPPLEDVERVEVLHGLSGFLYGFSSVGGSVNYVTKQPLDSPFAAISTGSYNKNIMFAQADVGGPIIGERLTYRLNLFGESGDTYIDGSEQRRQLFSGAVRYRLFDNTHLQVSCYHQHLDADGLQTYFDISGIGYKIPSAFDPTEQYGQRWTYNEAKKTVFDVSLVSRLSESLTLRAAYRQGTMWRKYCFVGAKLTDTEGNYVETFVDSDGNDETTRAAYALMDADFHTWHFRHHVTFGYTHWGFTFERGINTVAQLGPSSIDEQLDYDVPGRASGYDRRMHSVTHNFLVGDRIELSPAWSALAGINYARLETHFHGAYVSPPKPSYIAQDEFTPTIGLVYKPIPAVALYASYMEGLEQGGSAPGSAANAYEVLDPSVSKQYEIGVKTTLWGALDLTAALFRIDKVNEYTDPRNNVYRQDGRQVHEGLEFTATGKILENLTIIGGGTLLSAEIERADNNPAIEGETPINVPEEQARLYLEYRLPRVSGLPGFCTLSGGANYYGKRPVNIPNTAYIDDGLTLDAGVRYQPTEHLCVNVNIVNLLNKRYWSYYRSGSDGAGEDGLLLGDPRQISASVTYRF